MPYKARKDGRIVGPEDVEDGEEAECVDCGEVVTPRQSYYRDGDFWSRHFWHSKGTDGCESSGGESRKHWDMKQVARSKAIERWPDADVSLETSIGNRQADICAEFDGARDRYGEGVAIEVQYRHKDKDERAVEREYQEHGYTTLWLREQHYDGGHVDFDAGEWFFPWPGDVPSVEEWSGYHGIVKWLRQEKPATAEIEVELPDQWYRDVADELKPSINRPGVRSSSQDGWGDGRQEAAANALVKRGNSASVRVHNPLDCGAEMVAQAPLGSGRRLRLYEHQHGTHSFVLGSPEGITFAPVEVNEYNADRLRRGADAIATAGGAVDMTLSADERSVKTHLFIKGPDRLWTSGASMRLVRVEGQDAHQTDVELDDVAKATSKLIEFADRMKSVAG